MHAQIMPGDLPRVLIGAVDFAERERLFFEAMMRVLDRELPGYAD